MTLRHPLGRRTVPVVVMAAGAAVALVGSFLPWVRTGSRDRNSYDVFRVVERLGFAPDGPAATAMRWWPLVPLLAVAAVVAAWWGWARWGGTLGILAACYGAGAGIAVTNAPLTRLVDLTGGAIVTSVGAGILLVGSLAVLVVSSPTGRERRARP